MKARALAVVALAACAAPTEVSAPTTPTSTARPRMQGDIAWARGFAGRAGAIAQGHAGGAVFSMSFTGPRVEVGDVVIEAVDDPRSGSHLTTLLAETTAEGDIAWATRTTLSGAFYPASLEVAPNGDVLAVATSYGAVFDATTRLPSTAALAFVRFDDKGHLRSQRAYPGLVQSLAVAWSTRRACVAGLRSERLSFGDVALPAPTNGKAAAFVACVDDRGEPLWARDLASPDGVTASGLAIGPRDELTVTGSFWGRAEIAGASFVSKGEADAYVARFDTTGKPLWARAFGDAKTQIGWRVALDANGDTLLGGAFACSFDLGAAGRLEAPKDRDATFILRLDATGAPREARAFAGMSLAHLDLDPWGDLELAFLMPRDADAGLPLDVPPKSAPTEVDFCLAKLDGAKTLWARRYYEGGLGELTFGKGKAGDLWVAGQMKRGFRVHDRGVEHPTDPGTPSGFVGELRSMSFLTRRPTSQ